MPQRSIDPVLMHANQHKGERTMRRNGHGNGISHARAWFVKHRQHAQRILNGKHKPQGRGKGREYVFPVTGGWSSGAKRGVRLGGEDKQMRHPWLVTSGKLGMLNRRRLLGTVAASILITVALSLVWFVIEIAAACVAHLIGSLF